MKIGKLRKGYGFENNKAFNPSYLKKSKLEIVNDKKMRKLLYLFDETEQKLVTGCYIDHQTFSPDGSKIAYIYTILKKKKSKTNFFLLLLPNLIYNYCWINNN